MPVYTLDSPQQGDSKEYPQSMFWSKNKKKIGIPFHTPVLLYNWGIKGEGEGGLFHGHIFLGNLCY